MREGEWPVAISASKEKSKMHLTKTAIVNIGLREEEGNVLDEVGKKG